jgi:hypothetical protein
MGHRDDLLSGSRIYYNIVERVKKTFSPQAVVQARLRNPPCREGKLGITECRVVGQEFRDG